LINLKKHHKKKKLNKTIFFLIGALVVVIAVAILLYFKFAAKNESAVAATVNGEVITTEYINKLYMRLPAESRNASTEFETKYLILNQTIEDTLLFQEAKSSGITVSDEEVAQDINLTLEENGMTKEEFMELLKSRDISYQEAVEDFKQRLIIYRLINQTILSKVEVQNSEIEAYYYSNVANTTLITLNQSSEQIKQILFNEKAYNAIVAYVAELRAKSSIEIFMH